MDIRRLEINIRAEAFIALAQYVLPADCQDYIPLPLSSYPSDYKDMFNTVAQALLGHQLEDDDAPIFATTQALQGVDGKKVKKLYGPAIYSVQDEPGLLQIRFGKYNIKLKLTKTGIQLAEPPEQGEGGAFEVFCEFKQEKLQYKEECLTITVSNDAGEIILPCPLRPKNFEAPFKEGDTDKLTALLRRSKFAEITSQLAALDPEGNSTASSLPIFDIRDMPEGRYEVTDYKVMTRKNGKGDTAKLFVKHEGSEELKCIWGNGELFDTCAAKAEKPFSFKVWFVQDKEDSSKKYARYDISAKYPKGIDLSFLPGA